MKAALAPTETMSSTIFMLLIHGLSIKLLCEAASDLQKYVRTAKAQSKSRFRAELKSPSLYSMLKRRIQKTAH